MTMIQEGPTGPTAAQPLPIDAVITLPLTTNQPPDPFSLAQYRKGSGAKNVGVSGGEGRIQTIVPIRKPSAKMYFRCNPDPNYTAWGVPTFCKEKKDEEPFLIAPTLYAELPPIKGIVELNLILSMYASGTLFLLPFKESDLDWHVSGLIVIEEGKKYWVKRTANVLASCYEIERAKIPPPDPRWPDKPMDYYLRAAFGGRVIDSLEHPVLRELLGDFSG